MKNASDVSRRQVRDELTHEALQFVKEQRIRCLLEGAWFPQNFGYQNEHGPVTKQSLNLTTTPLAWRFVRLSHNRRYLHYADFDAKTDQEPRLNVLPEKGKHLYHSHPTHVTVQVEVRGALR